MVLAEKLDVFRRGMMAQHAIALPVSDQIHKPRDKGLEGYFFEEGASASARPIGTPGTVFIGAWSYLNGGSYLRDNVFIGRYCSIGRRVSLGAGQHAMSGLSTSPRLKPHSQPSRARRADADPVRGTSQAETVIMNDVWIGDGAVILSGVTINTGAVIGANSVVTTDVPAYAIMGGVPARHIRFRFDEDVRGRALESAWWEFPLSEIRSADTGDMCRFLGWLDEVRPRMKMHPFDTYRAE